MTTAPDTDQDSTLYGPDGRPLTRPATQPTGRAPRSSAASGDWKPVTTRDNATVWEKAPAVPAPVDVVPRSELQASQARTAELERRLAVEAAKDRQPAPAAHPAPAAVTAKPDPKKAWFDRQGPKIALFAAVVLCATGEYALGRLAGFPQPVAAFLPVAMDVYVVQAMRRHRDVAAALTLAVIANALDRLAEARLFGVDQTGAATWWLILVVVAIAPFIVWRVHRITETKPETKPVVSRPRRETTTPQTETKPETGQRETSETGETTVSVSPRETTVTAPAETETKPAETRRETTAETKRPQRETSETNRRETTRETKPRTTRPARETNPTTVTAIGDRETETTLLLDLMRSRGGAEKVSLNDAIAETGRPKATAAKRLAAARDLYTKTA